MRWRRTIDRRGRASRLTVSRLLRDFGFSGLGPESETTVQSRLEGVGISIDPPLSRAEPETVVTLDTQPPPSQPTQGSTPSTRSQAEPPRPQPSARPASSTESTGEEGSALRAAMGAAERIAELERALAEERAAKEDALRLLGEQEDALRLVAGQLAEEAAGMASASPAEPPAPTEPPPAPAEDRGSADQRPSGPEAAMPEIEVRGQGFTEGGREASGGRSIGPIRLGRRQAGGRERRRRRMIGRRQPTRCAVCDREAAASTVEELVVAGWIIEGEAGVCERCREDDWSLSPRTGLPYRPVTKRQQAD